jgi:hypothetical protein
LPEQLEGMMVATTLNLLSNNSTQNADHAAQVVKCSMKMYKEAYPHITELRMARSDGANDYSSVSFAYEMLHGDVKEITGIAYLNHVSFTKSG